VFFYKLVLLVTFNGYEISIILPAIKNISNNALESLAIDYADVGILYVVIQVHIV